jgi:hypothetical protein
VVDVIPDEVGLHAALQAAARTRAPASACAPRSTTTRR